MHPRLKKHLKSLQAEYNYLCSRRPRKIFFDHIPKTGGSSLNSFIQGEYPIRRSYLIDGRWPQKDVERFLDLPSEVKSKFDFIRGHKANLLLDQITDDFLKIVVFREPVDRIVSHYYYAKEMPHHYLNKKIIDNDLSLKDYVNNSITPEVENFYVCRFLQIQSNDARNLGIEAVDKAFNLIRNKYDIVGFTDKMSDFVSDVVSAANFTGKYSYVRSNQTKNRKKLSDIDDDTLNAIEMTNSLDIQLFKKLREHYSS